MVETVQSAAVVGLDVVPVRVEASIARGTPMIQVVGLPASAVREGRERIRAAARHVGLHVPGLRITVNLAPADVRKHGSAFDLPIVVAILAAAGKVSCERARSYALVGELSLDGSLRPVRGVLPIALFFREMETVSGLLVPRANLAETAPAAGHLPGGAGERRFAREEPRGNGTGGRGAGGNGARTPGTRRTDARTPGPELDVRGAGSLPEIVAFLNGEGELPTPADLPVGGGKGAQPGSDGAAPDLADVRGQERAKRALEVAAAGGHSVLLRGEPGAGKTLLARCLPTLLPELELREALEVTGVYSVAGRLPPGSGLISRPPFRAPHHTVTEAGLVGGGAVPRPGEVSLAHRGVLFLDELPEFRRRTLEVLRQPLEEGRVTVVRARGRASFPARFLLVAALNPCPCGYHGSSVRPERCTCQPPDVRRYLARISGPLLDRVDLRVDVPALTWRELRGGAPGSGDGGDAAFEGDGDPGAAGARAAGSPPRPVRSAEVRRRVVEARSRARRRARGGGSGLNAELTPHQLERHCRVDGAAEGLLERAVDRLGVSARGCHRVLRLARTVADLAGSEEIGADDVAEALGYRVEG